VFIVVAAYFSANREAGGHGQAQIRHFRQVGSFATQQGLHLCIAISTSSSKKVDILRCHLLVSHLTRMSIHSSSELTTRQVVNIDSPWFGIIPAMKSILQWARCQGVCLTSNCCRCAFNIRSSRTSCPYPLRQRGGPGDCELRKSRDYTSSQESEKSVCPRMTFVVFTKSISSLDNFDTSSGSPSSTFATRASSSGRWPRAIS